MKIFHHKKQYNSPKHPGDSFFRRIWNDPYFDWPFLVIVVSICAGVYIGIGFLTYSDIKGRMSAPLEPFSVSNKALFDAEALSVLLEKFDEKARENDAAKKGYTRVADPSL